MTATTLHLSLRSTRLPQRPASRRRRQLLSTTVLAAAVGAYLVLAGPSLFAPAAAGGGYTSFTAEHIGYLADPGDASRIAAVTFDLRPAGATAARVQLAPGGTWFACTVRDGAATCPTGATATFASLEQLAIEAH